MKNQSNTNIQESFLQLVRLGIGASKNVTIPQNTDWIKLKAIADEQGLSAIVLDGVEKLPKEQQPSQILLLQWIGEVLQGESKNVYQKEVAKDMANLFHRNDIRTYVLKGEIIAECYPAPSHRTSVDLDCCLLPDKGEFNAWELGNDLIRAKRIRVDTDFYKNSTFFLPGLTVENHQYLTPFRGNEKLGAFEQFLQSLLHADKGEDIIEGTWLYRPPVMVSALFIIEHAYSHFLHEGLTWRHVLDWMMFRKKHNAEIDWVQLNEGIDEYGFRRFYQSYIQLGKYLLGEIAEADLSKSDKRMLADVWATLDLHETVRGLKGKMALAGNTWRARWKYRHFTDISWVTALWIQVKGFLFQKNPTLN